MKSVIVLLLEKKVDKGLNVQDVSKKHLIRRCVIFNPKNVTVLALALIKINRHLFDMVTFLGLKKSYISIFLTHPVL